jgi:hypothetical protein
MVIFSLSIWFIDGTQGTFAVCAMCVVLFRLLCVPKPDTAIALGEAIKRQSCFNDVVYAKIAAHHFQIRRANTDADRRRVIPVRQHADITMQQVEAFRMHGDCKWQRLSLSP